MADELIPEDVRQFILDKIDSVAQLEGLLLLRGSPQTEWGVEALARRLYINHEEAAEVLNHLCGEGFATVERDEPLTCRYQPGSPELGRTVDRVAETYARYLVPVSNLIHSKPKTQVQKFADAFRLKKDK